MRVGVRRVKYLNSPLIPAFSLKGEGVPNRLDPYAPAGKGDFFLNLTALPPYPLLPKRRQQDAYWLSYFMHVPKKD
jgi:hypothetical protein